jgi:hypothetical protein
MIGVMANDRIALMHDAWEHVPSRSARIRRVEQDEFALVRSDTNAHSRQEHYGGGGPNLYKTRLCENWLEHGTCSYGIRCLFAHGAQELRPRPPMASRPFFHAANDHHNATLNDFFSNQDLGKASASRDSLQTVQSVVQSLFASSSSPGQNDYGMRGSIWSEQPPLLFESLPSLPFDVMQSLRKI